MSTALRYALLQIPGVMCVALLVTALWYWQAVSARTAGALLALWLVKDVAAYPLLRRAYDVGEAHGAERLVGRIGVARQRLAPSGYVTLNGELWRAELRDRSSSVEAGAAVRVVSARRLTLLVVSEDGDG